MRRLEDIIAWKLADSFKRSVYRLLDTSAGARGDDAFRRQLQASAASAAINIGEGFYRFSGRDFARYLSIAVASLGEAELWLKDGIDRGHFTPRDCEAALNLAKRCRIATLRFKAGLLRSMNDKPLTARDQTSTTKVRTVKNLSD